MKGRDLVILAAVLLVGGFALADTLRRATTPEPAREAGRTTTAGETTTAESPDEPDVGRASFPSVRGAGGSIVIAESGTCAVRELDVATGLELPNVVARSTCELWAAPVSAKVAVGIAEEQGDAVPFRFLDLAHPRRNLGTSEAAFGFLVWSADGQRAAWCNRRLVGIDLELGGGRRLLEGCPAAYTPEGEVAYARGSEVATDEGTILRASGGVTAVHFGGDGSVGVVVEGRRIERYENGELTDALDLDERLQGRLPVFSPDNCTGIWRAGDRVRLVDLGCSSVAGAAFPGHAAAWSPAGDWVVVGGPSDLVFHDLETGEEFAWPVGAARVFWRRG